jgi:hypothetical protein
MPRPSNVLLNRGAEDNMLQSEHQDNVRDANPYLLVLRLIVKQPRNTLTARIPCVSNSEEACV